MASLISRSPGDLCPQESAAGCPPVLRRYVLLAAILGSSLGFIDGTIITVAIQAIRDAFDASFGAVIWVANGYTLALSAFLLVGGAAGDRIGQRRVFGAGIVVIAAATALCAVAPTVEFLIAARVVQGLAAAFMVPGSLALIAVNYPPEERGRAVGTWAAASGITAAIGPILGGVLIDLGSWPAVFLINLPVAALALAILYGKVPADAARGQGRFDALGAVLAFAGVGLVAGALTMAEQRGLLAPSVTTLAGAGLVVLAVFVWWQGRVAAPMVPLSLFRQRTFAVANLLTFALYFALAGALFFLPLSLLEGRGWAATAAGSVFLPFTLAMAVVSPLAGRAMDRLGARPLLVVGPLVAAGSFFWLAQVVPGVERVWALAQAKVLLGDGMGLALPTQTAAVQKDAGEARSGIASGINNAVARVAGLFAIAVLGVLASALFAAAGLPGVGFAAEAAGVDDADRAAAVLYAFQGVTLFCCAMAVVGGVLALALPSLSR